MTEYKFDMERFRKLNGKLCHCLIPSKTTAIQENMCPCKEFIDTGICRCKLFNEV